MRVLVLWADDQSTNLGVRALAQGTAALVRSVWPDADVRYQGYGGGDAPLRIGAMRTLLKQYVLPASPLSSWIRDFDLVVDTRAGDSFADIYGVPRLALMAGLAELARKNGVPVVLGPQTIGPFDTRRGRWIGRRSLARSTGVLARDPISAGYAAGLGTTVDALTTDVVFAIEQPPPPAIQRDVVLNVSGLLYRDNPHVPAERYRKVIRQTCRDLRAAGRQVSLLAHVLDSPVPDNDVPAVRDVAAGLGGDVDVVVPESLADVRSIIAGARVVIGSRMHACLNALSVGTPALPLAYSRKFAPLMDHIGWTATVDLRDPQVGPDDVLAALDEIGDGGAVAAVRRRADRQLDLARQVLVALP